MMKTECQICNRPPSSMIHLFGHGYKSPTIKQGNRGTRKPKSSCKKCHKKPDAWVHAFGHSYKPSM